jgi:hypothetical protein
MYGPVYGNETKECINLYNEELQQISQKLNVRVVNKIVNKKSM